MARRDKAVTPLPSRDDIIAFIRRSTAPVDKRDIAREFGLRGSDKIALKQLLRELADEGLIDTGRRRVADPGTLPEVLVARVVAIDDDEPIAEPAVWRGEAAAPKIMLEPDRRGPGLSIGDRVLVRLARGGGTVWRGRVMRKLDDAPDRVIGIIEAAGTGFRLAPTDKRARQDYAVDRDDLGGAVAGDLVAAEALERMRLGLRRVRVVERLAGGARDPRAVSLICLHEQDIPIDFPAAALSQAEAAAPVGLGRRTDLRAVPLVTIDGADARDFDDAVWAEPDPDPENPGGWRTVVAIADVAHYVRPGDALDREAYKRGNSVYFPDRVVPMLPEPLSNGLCSLKPDEDRACLAVEMIVGPDGRKRGHRFMRGLMRSSARLTYEQVQGLADGNPPDDLPAGTPRETIGHLYAVYAALAAARSARGALELDMPERKVELDDNGHVKAIGRRQRLVSHQLIEELMILANVAAAEALERQRKPCMYRVHETPDPERVAALREFLDGMGLSFASGEVVRPKLFNRLLSQVAGTPQAQMVNELVLRSQAQAFYGPNNLGHFGLGLQRYAHFTSPIRRYADLLVHRGLIAALGLGDGGSEAEAGQLEEWGSHVSSTERRAAAAERAAMDRYAALYMADRVGEAMEGRVVGVTRFGLFVTLESGSADGLVPIRSLPQDYYDHDSNRHELAGRSLGHVFRLGDVLSVRVTAVDSVAGTVTLDFLDGGTRGKPTGRPRVGRGRPPPRRTSRNGRRGR